MPQKRIFALGSLFLLLLLGLIAALAVLIFGRGSQLTAAAAEQRLRSLSYYQYARGDILDRSGRPLVNIEESCLVVLPALLPGREEQLSSVLSGLLSLDADQIEARLEEAAGSSYQPVVLKTGLTAEQASLVAGADLPGVLVLDLAARYDRDHTASQLIGSVRPVNGGWAGASGLERQYDRLLSGREDLQVRIQVDARGVMNGEALAFRPETVRAGALSLTLDRDYQQIAEQALAESGLAGSCVVMDPNNGDILALASCPGFDPYGWQEAPEGAYMQRSLLTYPPASTFKTVLAAAALAEGVRPENGGGEESERESAPEQESDAPEHGAFICGGSYTLEDGRTVYCAGGQAHGEVDLAEALASSCNCYFVALGQSLGGEKVLSYGRLLGLDRQEAEGLALAEDGGGFLDFDPEHPGELANACLGEAGIGVSPLQEAVRFSAFANGGFLVCPRLVTETRDGAGRKRSYTAAAPRRVLEAAQAEALRLMLVRVVEQGTGRSARGQWVSAGGKTGSSETGTVWFSGFFPAEQPRLVAVVCLEGGSAGGVEAAAVFSRVADAITLLDGRI